MGRGAWRWTARAAVWCALLGATLWVWGMRERRLIEVSAEIPSIMGTRTMLKAIVRAVDEPQGQAALRAAEGALREVEEGMSTWAGSTEVSRLNAATAGAKVALSAETMEVMRLAERMARETDGAFDATCRPVLEMWKACEGRGREPEEGEVRAALERSGWRWFVLGEGVVEKKHEEAGVDLGGISKGYAVDQAVKAMRKAGAVGGMVQCGGDLRVFGEPAGGGSWRVGVRDPDRGAGDLRPETLEIRDLAVSTSGNYERYVTIGGKRHSHIVDPRTGRTVDDVPQVTVVGADSAVCDGWSTALSVLGGEGLGKLPKGVDAMIIERKGEGIRVVKTPGFARYTPGTETK